MSRREELTAPWHIAVPASDACLSGIRVRARVADNGGYLGDGDDAKRDVRVLLAHIEATQPAAARKAVKR